MPARSEVEPTAFFHALPKVWICDWLPQSVNARCRISGDDIDRIYGKSLRGLTLEHYVSPEMLEKVRELYRHVAEEPAIYHSIGKVYVLSRDLHGYGERVILPLSDDGTRTTHFLGVTDYSYLQHLDSPEDLKPDGGFDDVEEQYLPLDAADDWDLPVA